MNIEKPSSPQYVASPVVIGEKKSIMKNKHSSHDTVTLLYPLDTVAELITS